MATAINRYNFLRWYPIGSLDDDKENPVFLPHLTAKSLPLMVPGESMAFCINRPLSDAGTATLKIIKADSLTVVSSPELSKLECEEGNIYYSTFTVPTISKGFYRLALLFDGTIKYASNVVFSTNRGYNKISSIIKYRHSSNIFSYPYDSIPTFYNQFRLAVIEEERQPDYDIDQYRAISTGVTRNYNFQSNLYIKFNTVGFDDKANEALSFMLEHSAIYINGEKVTYKTGYKLPSSGTNGKGDFEVWLDRFNTDKSVTLTEKVVTPTKPTYYNTVQSASFTKNNCGSGYSGSSVVYTVAAGTYSYVTPNDIDVPSLSQACADQLAWDDVQANGQAYANAHGTCSLTTLLNDDFSSESQLDNWAIVGNNLAKSIDNNRLKLAYTGTEVAVRSITRQNVSITSGTKVRFSIDVIEANVKDTGVFLKLNDSTEISIGQTGTFSVEGTVLNSFPFMLTLFCDARSGYVILDNFKIEVI